MSAQTQLVEVPPKETALQVFQTANGLDPFLKKIRDEIDLFVPDTSTVKGRKAIASIAYKVAQSKTALDNVGKELVAELKEIPKKVDAERKRMRDLLDGWQEEVRRPLTEWQDAEDARIDKHNDRLNWLKALAADLGELTSLHLDARIAEAEGMQLGAHWEEFEADAGTAKDKVLTSLRAALAKRNIFEAEQEELARLRAEAQERAKKERDEQIAREAADRGRREAELRAQEEREAAERREQALRQQAEAAEQARIQAEEDRIATEQRAEQERTDAARREREAAERAREEERRRADAAAAEIVRQQDARESDETHRRTINRTALEAFIAGGVPEACAKQAVTLIAQRKIPNITISY